MGGFIHRKATRTPTTLVNSQEGTDEMEDTASIRRAKISFLVDVALAVATLAFLYVWVTASSTYFSPYFIEYGFCNSIPQHFHTQRNCAYFDWMVSFLIFLVSANRRWFLHNCFCE